MTARARRATRVSDDGLIWPGFVDGLGTLLLVTIFLLSVFMAGQSLLGRALSGRDATITRLDSELAQTRNRLAQSEAARDDLRAEARGLRQALAETGAERDRALQAAEETEDALREAEDDAQSLGDALARSQARADAFEAETARLDVRLERLRTDFARVREALGAAEADNAAKDATIADLTAELNVALAREVERLQRYRSAFFERMSEVLSGRADVTVVGDRFVFESDILFDTASAELRMEGRDELDLLAGVLMEIALEIPDEVDWIVRIDGHSDARPIATPAYPTNWHLSAARAIAVVEHLAARGVPARRLAAAGFGSSRPMNPAATELAYQANRRIEFKLTER